MTESQRTARSTVNKFGRDLTPNPRGTTPTLEAPYTPPKPGSVIPGHSEQDTSRAFHAMAVSARERVMKTPINIAAMRVKYDDSDGGLDLASRRLVPSAYTLTVFARWSSRSANCVMSYGAGYVFRGAMNMVREIREAYGHDACVVTEVVEIPGFTGEKPVHKRVKP